METGETIPAAAPPTDRTFVDALAAFQECLETFTSARDALDLAQVEQAAALNALPPAERADMAQQEVIAERLKLNELGTAALDAMQKVDRALEELMAVPAPSDFALFLKLKAFSSATWDMGDHLHMERLLADAATLSLQFGKVWLKRWTEKGGSATMDPEVPDRVWIGHPAYFLSPVAAEDEARLAGADIPADQKAEQKRWHGTFYDGKMKELSDFLDDVPGGLEAVKALVATNPALGLPKTAADAGEAVQA